MAAPILLISIFPVEPGAARSSWSDLKDDDFTRYLFSLDRRELLQLRGYEGLAALAASAEALDADRQRFAPHMTGEVRRELLSYVEAPKPSPSLLPLTHYLQLRHVEVPPPRQAEYRTWRANTIFTFVRQSEQIHTFLAYHSLISGQPGVMFLSGFAGDPEAYLEIFESERYRDIVRQAGDRFIAGGSNGLYTRLYARPGLPGALA
jgi:hypothetical protein